MLLRDLLIRIGFDASDKPLKRIDAGINIIKSSVKKLTYAFIGSAGLGAAFGYLLKKAGDLEQIEIAFETMLGSVEKSEALLSDLFRFAEKTPFEIPELLENTKLLLAMGIESDKMIETLTNLGNVAAGLSVPIQRMALNFGQVKTQAKLTGRELKDFAVLGVDLLGELAEMLGKTKVGVREMVSAGDISFKLVEGAFARMAGEGGRYANLMERQAETLLGSVSNLKDVITIMSWQIGKVLLPEAKKLLSEALIFLEVNKKILKLKAVEFLTKISKLFLKIYKILKSTIISINDLANAFGGLERVIINVAIAFGILTGATILYGIGSIAMGISALIAVVIKLGIVVAATKAIMLAMPLLVGIAIAALALVLEDIRGYFQGKDSLTEVIIDAFEKKFPKAFGVLKAIFIEIGKGILNVWELIKGFAKISIGTLLFDFDLIREGLKQVYNVFVDTFTKIGNSIKNLLMSAFDFILDTAVFKTISAIIEKAAKFIGIGGDTDPFTLSPATSPVQSSVSNMNSVMNAPNILINSPITVNVPASTSPHDVGPRVQAGVKDALGEILRKTWLDTSPKVEY